MRDTRRLSAVLFSDIKGYSRQMDLDEAGALARLDVHNALFRDRIVAHGGREVKTVGDAFMVEFPSAVSAVACALDVQRALARHNEGAAEPILVRIGVHVGDVVDRGGDLFGETVNLAARLEPQAPPGAVCVSDAVLAQVMRKVDASAEDLGVRPLKNVAPLRLWALRPSDTRLERAEAPASRAPRRAPAAALALGAAVLAAGGAWWLTSPPSAGGEVGAPVEAGVPGATDRVLRVGIGGEWGDSFDPYGHVVSLSRVVSEIVMEPLVWARPDGTVSPGAVDRWEVRQDGAEIELFLAPHVAFHPHPCVPEGRPATPADLAWSVRYAATRGLQVADQVHAGAEGVTLRVAEPVPFPLHALGEVQLLPEGFDTCAEASAWAVGTGPYRMTGPLAGEALTLAPSTTRPGRLPGLELRPVGLSDPAAVDEIAAGRLDLAMLWQPTEVVDGLGTREVRLKDALAGRGVALTPCAPNQWFYLLSLAFPRGDGPWADPHVRRALALALDRDVLAPLHPGEQTPWGRQFHPRWLGYDPALAPLRHDPEAAAAALAEGGHPGGVGLPPLVVGTKDERRAMTEALADQLARIGVRVDVRAISQQTMGQVFAQGTLDAVTVQFQYVSIGTDPFPALVRGPGEGLVQAGARIAAIRRRAATVLDRTQRGRVYAELERELLAELPAIPIAYEVDDTPSLMWVHRTDVAVPAVDPATGWTADTLGPAWWRELAVRQP